MIAGSIELWKAICSLAVGAALARRGRARIAGVISIVLEWWMCNGKDKGQRDGQRATGNQVRAHVRMHKNRLIRKVEAVLGSGHHTVATLARKNEGMIILDVPISH